MDDFNYIKQKLAAFIRRFYMNELLKGAILFFSIWLLYLIIILLIEYFLWLSPLNRTLLFWIFIGVSLFLLYRFVAIPILKLFNLSKGIDMVEASKIIGKHFPEVNDKLLNVLQLQNSTDQSDLLLAGIAQKSKELKPIPFKLAVNFRSNLKYLKYAAFPVLIILIILITGNISVFSDSYSRVVHYQTAYQPPAPFSFFVNENELRVEQGRDLEIKVRVDGKLVPETVSIHFNDQDYLLKSLEAGVFTFQFEGLQEDVDFYLSANDVESLPYHIDIIEVPVLLDFEMQLVYPKYLNRKNENLKGTGNATLPEGTKVTWKLDTKTTEVVNFVKPDTIQQFERDKNIFRFSDAITSTLQYQIKTSNNNLKDYEALDYTISVVKDQFPKIDVQVKRDSIDKENLYFLGNASDDYGISKVNMVYYPENQEESAEIVNIISNSGTVTQFPYAFPRNLELEKGMNYKIYFEVKDNDGINGSKSSKSEIISYRVITEEELKEENLKDQQQTIENLTDSFDEMKSSEKELEEMTKAQKQKDNLNYNDRKKLDEFLKRQEQQSEMMKNYSDKLKKTLEDKNSSSPENQDFKEDLKDRLDRNEERLEENEALRKELEEYSEKINSEELTQKLENLAKQNNSEQRNLEQLLELTKRYYVQEKTRKLANDLEKLAGKQEELSKKDSENTKENQEQLTEEFNDFIEEMNSLEKENEKLKKPFEMDQDKGEEEKISKDQKEAEESLQQNDKNQAKKEQKQAAEKMKEMSSKLKESQSSQQGEQLNANVESMRQILDNLIKFSFEQEALMLQFKNTSNNDPVYAKQLRRQQVLKEHFNHIDDSIFSLALQNPMMTESINSKLTNIEFDIDKSLERLSENQVPQGTASQQYVMTGTNELANMLSDVLSNMEEQLNPSAGKGNGEKGLQLPDIIQSQEQLSEQMEKGMKKMQDEQKGEGNKPNEKSEQFKEEMSGELFNIYKQQQELRKLLEDKLKQGGLDRSDVNLLKELEKIEDDILDKGYNPDTKKRMDNIAHKLMELQNSELTQEEESKRTSKTNRDEFKNSTKDQIDRAKEYFNTIEILSRQSLPLRQIYKTKVKQYFDARED